MNEMAHLFSEACRAGDLRCLAFSLRDDRMKGTTRPQGEEEREGMTILYRSTLRSREIIEEAGRRKFHPRIVWSGTDLFLTSAGRAAKRLQGRVLLHTEYLGNPDAGIRRRHWLGIPPLRRTGARIHAKRLSISAYLTVVSDPLFKPIQGIPPERVTALAWPSYDPPGPPEPFERRSGSTFIGALSMTKGLPRLLEGYDRLLDATPDFNVRLVGAPAGRKENQILAEFRERHGARVEYFPPMSRDEAVALLRKSLFVYCPVGRLHWGLINDAWSNGVPVLSGALHYDLKNGENCILATAPEALVHAAAMVRDGAYPGNLLEGGMRTWREKHSPGAVLPQLLRVLSQGGA